MTYQPTRPPITEPPPVDLPEPYRALVLAYEAELDRPEMHPGWRRFEPFNHLGRDGSDASYRRFARVKWLLMRRKLLLHRDDAGLPAPRDWEVRVVPDPRRAGFCYVQPIEPRHSARQVTGEPPPIGLVISDPHPTGGSIVPF